MTDEADVIELLRRGVEQAKNMTEDERRTMWREQGKSYARAEASWPKPKYKMVNGVKVYESYEDYCND